MLFYQERKCGRYFQALLIVELCYELFHIIFSRSKINLGQIFLSQADSLFSLYPNPNS